MFSSVSVDDLRVTRHCKQRQAAGCLSTTEFDIGTMDSEAPTLYLGFSNVLHRGEASLDTLGRVTLESGEKPFGDTKHLSDALAPYPNLCIVLTSSWAWWLGDAEVIALLPPALARRVVGTTREFPLTIDEAESGCGYVGSIIRHATANRLKSWLAIGSDFRGVPNQLARHFLELPVTGLGSGSNREALRASLRSNFNSA